MTNEVKEDFSVVYEKNFSYIYNYTYGQVLHRERTEDLVSETFMKALSHYESFDPARASVKTWLTNIAHNTIIDYYRRSGRFNGPSLDDENTLQPSYEDEYKALEEPINREVYLILTKLSEQERELLSMIYFQNMKNPEIAEVLGINAKAVSERHRRLLAKCRQLEAGKDFHELFE